MAKKEISVFTLSLLDLLFCAFGGVIVLTVVFSAIIKYDQAQSEKSPQVAISLDIQYSNPSGFPDWTLGLRKSPANAEMINVTSINIFETSEFLIFDEIIHNEIGKFQFAFNGNLKLNLKDSTLSDTLFLQILDNNVHNPTPEWRNKSGQIEISTLIYRQGQLPEKIELQPLAVDELYMKNQSIPIIFSLYKDKISLQTF
jgi:hypothetical protein